MKRKGVVARRGLSLSGFGKHVMGLDLQSPRVPDQLRHFFVLLNYVRVNKESPHPPTFLKKALLRTGWNKVISQANWLWSDTVIVGLEVTMRAGDRLGLM